MNRGGIQASYLFSGIILGNGFQSSSDQNLMPKDFHWDIRGKMFSNRNPSVN